MYARGGQAERLYQSERLYEAERLYQTGREVESGREVVPVKQAERLYQSPYKLSHICLYAYGLRVLVPCWYREWGISYMIISERGISYMRMCHVYD